MILSTLSFYEKMLTVNMCICDDLFGIQQSLSHIDDRFSTWWIVHAISCNSRVWEVEAGR